MERKFTFPSALGTTHRATRRRGTRQKDGMRIKIRHPSVSPTPPERSVSVGELRDHCGGFGANRLPVLAVAAVQEYHLQQIYDELLSHRHSCVFMDDERSALLCALRHEGRGREVRFLQRARSVDGAVPLLPFADEPISDGNTALIPCFILASGVVVVWGLTLGQAWRCQSAWAAFSHPTHHEMSLLSDLLHFLGRFSEPLPRADWQKQTALLYSEMPRLREPDHGGSSRISSNTIFLRTTGLEEKLAVSLALSQAVRTDVLEEAVDSIVRRIKHLPILQLGRPRGAPDRDLPRMKQVAEVYSKIVDLNLVQELLDVPECFWDNHTFQPVWSRVHRHFQVETRFDILNRRCALLQELLNDDLGRRSQNQEFRLTLIVIALLVFQLSIKLVHTFIGIYTHPKS
eukprot:Polyplicarium_translucidae@DN13_c0_g1_i1.p1